MGVLDTDNVKIDDRIKYLLKLSQIQDMFFDVLTVWKTFWSCQEDEKKNCESYLQFFQISFLEVTKWFDYCGACKNAIPLLYYCNPSS